MRFWKWFRIVTMIGIGVPVAGAETVDSSAISASLDAKEPAVMVGVPAYLEFKIKNNSARILEIPIGLPADHLFTTETVKAFDEAGKEVPAPPLMLNNNGMGGWAPLAPGGQKEFTLSANEFVRITKAGVYRFVVSPSFPVRFAEDGGQPTVIPVKAVAQLTVSPVDEKKMGELIENLAGRMMAAKHDESAAGELAGIQDPRVVPWFVQAFKSGDYELEYLAAEVLGKYDSDEAVDALEQGLYYKDSNIQLSACFALLGSPAPKATAALLKHLHDDNDEIRNQILDVTWRLDRKEAVATLQGMVNDKSPTVRTNVANFLRIRKAEPEQKTMGANATADEYWKYFEGIQAWVQASPSPLGLDRISKATEDFTKRYPKDKRRWKARLDVVELEEMMDNAQVMMTLGASFAEYENVEPDLREIAAAPDADKEVTVEAQRGLDAWHQRSGP